MKLIRDHIPEIIDAAGDWCLTRRVHGIDEHIIMLREKILEETDEFIKDPSYEEAGDMLEVLRAFFHLHELDFNIVINTADKKRKDKGGFLKGIILKEVGTNAK